MKGIFITFEGPDGAGKTTQINELARILEQQGHAVVLTREPGGTLIGDKVRELLLAPEHDQMVDQAEVLLYAASRAQHVHEKILPALAQGAIVLCDRYIDASIAYQAAGLGMDEALVRLINQFASSGLQPDRTYMLDLSVEEGRKRLTTRAEGSQVAMDRIELKGEHYHARVREGFARIAQADKERIIVVDASQEASEITRLIAAECIQLVEHIRTTMYN